MIHIIYLRIGGKRLTVVWPIEKECGIHFWEVFAEDMFNDIDLKIIEVTSKRYFDDYKGDGVFLNIKKGHYKKAIYNTAMIVMDRLQEIKRKIVLTLMFGRNHFDYTPPKDIGWAGKKYQEYSMNIWKQVHRALLKSREIYIKAYCGIIMNRGNGGENNDFSAIKFRDEYWKKVEEIIVPKEKYIGIHIRRTDHTVAINASTTKAFLQRMNEIIEKQDDAKFFLATDDVTEEENLRKIYGDKIVVQTDKKWGRASSSEMKSGIIDCLCLSRCEYIIGSYTSVYSSFAAKYGGKKLIICKDKEHS